MKKQLLSILLVMMSLGAAAQSMYGDVNSDGVVNISDVNHIINIILDGGYDSNSDVNSDGQVNITDLNVIIELILNPNVEPPVEEGDWVDLGLPSGTIWATRNVGASAPEDYGDYFAWGETSPKDYYDWITYKWGYYDNKGNWQWTKYYFSYYDHSSQSTITGDNKTKLDPADDAARANWGSGARMPSMEQIQELRDKCSWQWTQRNGVYGQQGTGPNGNTIFLPAAGDRWSESLYYAGSSGYYWSRTLFSSGSLYAYCLYFNSDGVYWYGYHRYDGLSVRAVRVS